MYVANLERRSGGTRTFSGASKPKACDPEDLAGFGESPRFEATHAAYGA